MLASSFVAAPGRAFRCSSRSRPSPRRPSRPQPRGSMNVLQKVGGAIDRGRDRKKGLTALCVPVPLRSLSAFRSAFSTRACCGWLAFSGFSPCRCRPAFGPMRGPVFGEMLRTLIYIPPGRHGGGPLLGPPTRHDFRFASARARMSGVPSVFS